MQLNMSPVVATQLEKRSLPFSVLVPQENKVSSRTFNGVSLAFFTVVSYRLENNRTLVEINPRECNSIDLMRRTLIKNLEN